MNFLPIYHFLYFLCIGIGIGICAACKSLDGILYLFSLALISPIVWISRAITRSHGALILTLGSITIGVLCGYSRTKYIMHISHNTFIPHEIKARVISCEPHGSSYIKTRLVVQTIDTKVTILCWAPDVLLLYPDDQIAIRNIQHVSLPINTQYGRYVLTQNCLISLRVFRKDIQLIARPQRSLQRSISLLREKLLTKSVSTLSIKAKSLTTALFWGKSGYALPLTVPESAQFQQWGITHYLARSGLHVYIFTGILTWVLYYIPLGIYIKNFFILLLLFIYSFLSWTTVSFMRALYAYSITVLARSNNAPLSGIYTITLIATLVLLYNPFFLFAFDFQMSFGLTFALVWWYQLLIH